MDGKYAKYIQNFMKNFKVSGEKVEIQTDSNAKNKPLTYDLTGDIVENCNDKLDTQYQIITDKKDEIKKDLTAVSKIATIIAGVVFIFAFLLTLTLPITDVALLLGFKIATIISAMLTIMSVTTLAIQSKTFETIVNIAKEYKKNRKDIERTMNYDENIIKYLSNDTKKMLTEKTKLVETGKSSEILDMDFMDKLLDKKAKGRRELINLLNMYKAVISLKEEPKYIALAGEKAKTPKKKSRKKDTK